MKVSDIPFKELTDEELRMHGELPAAGASALDELLNSVNPGCGVHVWLEAEPEPENGITGAHYMATLYFNGGPSVFGDGTTRMDAIRNAVAQATTQEGGGDE